MPPLNRFLALIAITVAASGKSPSPRLPSFDLRAVLTHDAEYYGTYVAHGPTASSAQEVLQFTVASNALDPSVLLIVSSLDVEAARRNVRVAHDTWIESEESAFTKSFYPSFKWRFDFSGKGYSSGMLFEAAFSNPKQVLVWKPLCSFNLRYTVLEEPGIRAIAVSSGVNATSLPADGAAKAKSPQQQHSGATACTMVIQPQKENGRQYGTICTPDTRTYYTQQPP